MSIIQPKVSVIIVNWNTCDLLKQCLDSVCATCEKESLEIIVVDNGSKDSSCDLVRRCFPNVKLIENDWNRGFCKATNQGIEIATGLYVLLLNSDTIAEQDSIERMVRFANERERVGIVGCKLVFADGSYQSSCFRFPNLWGNLLTSFGISRMFPKSYLLNWDRYGNRKWSSPRRVDCVMGSCMMIKRSVIDKIGMLDAAYFMFAEETDFCYRAMQAGWEVFYYPDAKVVHHHSGSQKTWNDLAWAFGAIQRGIYLFMYKWRSRFTLVMSNLVFIITLLLKCPLWLLGDIFACIIEAKQFELRRSLKMKCLPFHFRALLNPAMFNAPWGKE